MIDGKGKNQDHHDREESHGVEDFPGTYGEYLAKTEGEDHLDLDRVAEKEREARREKKRNKRRAKEQNKKAQKKPNPGT